MNQISNFSIEPVLIVEFSRSNFVNKKSVYVASILENLKILKIYFPQNFDKLIDSIVLHSVTDLSNPLICLGVIQKVCSLRRGGGI